MSAAPPEVLMYTRRVCAYCVAAKNLLRAKGVTWREINLDESPQELEAMVQRSGRRTVPQVFIGDRHVGGYDDLVDLDREGKLNPLLGLSPRQAAR